MLPSLPLWIPARGNPAMSPAFRMRTTPRIFPTRFTSSGTPPARGEDQREWMVYTVDTDDYTYLYAFGTIADEADDMQDVFYNICDHLELVD